MESNIIDKFHQVMDVRLDDLQRSLSKAHLTASLMVLEDIRSSIYEAYSMYRSTQDSSGCISKLVLVPSKINQLSTQIIDECGSNLDLRFSLIRMNSALLNNYSGLIVSLSKDVNNDEKESEANATQTNE